MLDLLDYKSGIIIVQKKESIQEAINASSPGDIIFLEPGIYKEAINITKPNIKLIGLNHSKDKSVILEKPKHAEKGIKETHNGKAVEIFNIEFRQFENGNSYFAQQKYTTKPNKPLLLDISRKELGNGLTHYKFEIQVEESLYGRVRLHRIVMETHPYQPVALKGDLFMIHGAIQDFDDIYLTAGANNTSTQTSVALYLASKQIDVWGIDLAWTFVPKDTTDFSFMKDWGIDKDIDHILKALSTTRLIRAISNQNFDKINLLGFSYSVMIAYGAAGRESQQASVSRHIKGLIPVDQAFKQDPKDEEFRLNACYAASKGKEFLDKGTLENNWGVLFIKLSNLALTAPDEASPIPDFSGMTNSQVIHFMGALKYMNGNSAAPYWHFVGGDLNNLLYTDAERWLKLTASLVPFQPGQQLYEYHACICDEIDLQFDDHLSDITLPIYYLGASGGTGTLGEYSCKLTASTDLTFHIVTIPNTEAKIDFGHADLFLGRNADKLAWEALCNWLVSHNNIH